MSLDWQTLYPAAAWAARDTRRPSGSKLVSKAPDSLLIGKSRPTWRKVSRRGLNLDAEADCLNSNPKPHALKPNKPLVYRLIVSGILPSIPLSSKLFSTHFDPFVHTPCVRGTPWWHLLYFLFFRLFASPCNPPLCHGGEKLPAHLGPCGGSGVVRRPVRTALATTGMGQ